MAQDNYQRGTVAYSNMLGIMRSVGITPDAWAVDRLVAMHRRSTVEAIAERRRAAVHGKVEGPDDGEENTYMAAEQAPTPIARPGPAE